MEKKADERNEEGGRRDGGGVRLGKYEVGRTLGEGNFGKVKYARHVETGQHFAVKILDRKRIQDLKTHNQIMREIATLKLLKHPNVVRLYEVLASKTKIYMVLEYVNGGELFEKIVSKQKLSEREGRKLFQQLIDAVEYCHFKGVYHRDLKPENVLVDSQGNIKISDFGLSALPEHLGNDGLLHTTCGSPNYIAPEILQNRGYDGARSDIWACGVILYVILTGYLPFDDGNLSVLYQKIFRGDVKYPKWLSPGARNLLKRLLDPSPVTRIDIAGIKADDWFKKDYVPVIHNDDDEDSTFDNAAKEIENNPNHVNAFELIGMSSSLDLSGFFEKEDISERKIRYMSNYSMKDLFEKIEKIAKEMGFQVHQRHRKLRIKFEYKGLRSPKSSRSLSVTTQVFEVSPTLSVVELRKCYGDSLLYRQLCDKLSDETGFWNRKHLLKSESVSSECSSIEEISIEAL